MFIRNVRTVAAGPLLDVRIDGARVVSLVEAGSERPDFSDDVIDGLGGVVLPGFVDNHVHLTQWALARAHVDVAAAASAIEAADLIVAAGRSGAVVRGSGFRDALWPDAPHKDILERALPGRAIAVASMDLHTLWLSPALLDMLGLVHPTGVVRDHDCLAVTSAIDRLGNVAHADAAVHEATRELARRGVTEIVDFEFADNHTDWSRRAAASSPSVRVRASVWPQWLDEALELGTRRFAGARRLLTGPLKVMFDGSLNTRTACCHDPYPGMTGDDAHGLLLESPQALASMMAAAAAGGITPAIHAIGDRANTLVLDAFESVGCTGRIEHAQQVLPEDLARFAALGVTASVQPQHAMADRDVADELWDGRRSRAFAYGSLHAAGARLRFGSDAPVSAPQPLASVADAVFRTDDQRPPWHPDESVPLATALAAACSGRGRVDIGDRADLVVLAEDPAAVGHRDLRRVPVLATLLDGEPTHRADATA